MPESKSYIQVLSPELLGRVFDAYAHKPDGENHFIGLETTLFSSCEGGFYANPVILSHVSKNWRTISLDRPSLWSTMIMVRPIASHIPKVENWLERSKTAPLTLQIMQTIPDDDTPDRTLREERTTVNTILEMLLRHIDRWDTITFFLCIGFLPAFAEFPQSRLDQLKSATLNLATWSTHPQVVDRVFRAIHAAPKLEFVSWCASFFQSGLPHHVPWQQLKRIELDVNDISEEPSSIGYVLDILSKCPQLTSAKFILGFCKPTMPKALLTTLVLPNLRSLTLDEASSPNIAYVLQNLTLPSLHALYLSLFSDKERSPANLFKAVGSLVGRSKCIVKYLGLDIDEEQLLKLLPFARDVEVLRVGGTKTKKFTSLLTRNANDKTSLEILPKLEYLHLTYAQDAMRPHRILASTAALNRMVVSRTSQSPASPGLKKLKFISVGTAASAFQTAPHYAYLGDVLTPDFEVSAL
ncbi:hypothetical protein NLJ89_g8750 [Agrocybe chaxingu]|uniref:F-box domain-containing protein n=1 Tax=Agrocybe chaxingu TaxID=84603 RepID=A0A9W8K1V8_9AGAR|nr:hypothetical protein NLJ89_g8750 [Agrocybe chaxingu]